MNITESQIKKIVKPGGRSLEIRGFVEFFNKHADKFEINTYLRVCHFVAQCAEECDHFNTMEEYASGKAYEGRKDLGNVHPGDGVKYKGRGFIMITGRANYDKYGKLIGVDLVNNPSKASEYENAILIALEYWKLKNLNVLADRDDIGGITKGINGGFNGFDVRKAFLTLSKIEFKGIEFGTPIVVPPPPNVIVPPVIVPPTKVKASDKIAGVGAVGAASLLTVINFSNPWVYAGIGAVILVLVIFLLRNTLFKKKG